MGLAESYGIILQGLWLRPLVGLLPREWVLLLIPMLVSSLGVSLSLKSQCRMAVCTLL